MSGVHRTGLESLFEAPRFRQVHHGIVDLAIGGHESDLGGEHGEAERDRDKGLNPERTQRGVTHAGKRRDGPCSVEPFRARHEA